MKTQTFDAITRGLAMPHNRRSAIRLVLGTAAITALGLRAGGEAARAAPDPYCADLCANGDCVSTCFAGGGSKSGCVAMCQREETECLDTCVPPACPPGQQRIPGTDECEEIVVIQQPDPSEQVCSFVLAGGPSPSDPIPVDDDLNVNLNGTLIYQNADGVASLLAPVAFKGNGGDLLTVEAIDTGGYCRAIGPLYVHELTKGTTQFLAARVDDGCDPNRPAGETFYRDDFRLDCQLVRL